MKDEPNSLVAINNVVSLLLDNHSDKASLDSAFALAEKLKDSNVPQFEDTRGWAQYKRGNTTEAVATLEDAAKKLPKLAAVQISPGDELCCSGTDGQSSRAVQGSAGSGA